MTERTPLRVTEGDVVAALDAIDGNDPEAAHAKADDVILDALPEEIQDAYSRVAERCRWWAYA